MDKSERRRLYQECADEIAARLGGRAGDLVKVFQPLDETVEFGTLLFFGPFHLSIRFTEFLSPVDTKGYVSLGLGGGLQSRSMEEIGRASGPSVIVRDWDDLRKIPAIYERRLGKVLAEGLVAYDRLESARELVYPAKKVLAKAVGGTVLPVRTLTLWEGVPYQVFRVSVESTAPVEDVVRQVAAEVSRFSHKGVEAVLLEGEPEVTEREIQGVDVVEVMVMVALYVGGPGLKAPPPTV